MIDEIKAEWAMVGHALLIAGILAVYFWFRTPDWWALVTGAFVGSLAVYSLMEHDA